MGVTSPSATSLVDVSTAATATRKQVYRTWETPAMQAILRVIAEIAPLEVPVLIVGESGTGKDVIAETLHDGSRHRRGSFRKLHCSAATPEHLAFGGAQADAGTLYLDEIADLSFTAQQQFLGSLVRSEDAVQGRQLRLVCASSHNLEELMRDGRFLEALFFRLNVVSLRLPPLRHCRQDIPGLAQFFLAKFAAMFGRPRPAPSAPELRALAGHSWPGNIRELESTMKQSVVLGGEIARMIEGGAAPQELQGLGLMPDPLSAGGGPSLKEAARAASRQAERQMILDALARTRWNRKRAARELRISYKALLYKLKQIEPGEVEGR